MVTVSAIAEYEYTAKEADELNLVKGAIIHNVKMKPGGWWEGTLGGKSGVFPDNFVKILEADDKSPVILRYLYLSFSLFSNSSFFYESQLFVT